MIMERSMLVLVVLLVLSGLVNADNGSVISVSCNDSTENEFIGISKDQTSLLLVVGLFSSVVFSTAAFRLVSVKKPETVETFFDAGRNVPIFLSAVAISAQMLRPMQERRTALMVIKYGVAGGFYLCLAMVLNLLLFPFVSHFLTTKAPGAKTFLQAVKVKFGPKTHGLYITFSLLVSFISMTTVITEAVYMMQDIIVNISEEYCVIVLILLSVVGPYCGGLGLTLVIKCWCFLIATIYAFTCTMVFFYKDNDYYPELPDLYKRIKTCVSMPESRFTFRSVSSWIDCLMEFFLFFSYTFLNQVSWQSRIASRADIGAGSFVFGALLWFTIPLTMGTSLGLLHLYLYPNIIPANEDDIYLATALVIDGMSIVLMVVVNVVSTLSGDVMAVTSIFVLDIYHAYFKPSRLCTPPSYCQFCRREKYPESSVYSGSVRSKRSIESKGGKDNRVTIEEKQKILDKVTGEKNVTTDRNNLGQTQNIGQPIVITESTPKAAGSQINEPSSLNPYPDPTPIESTTNRPNKQLAMPLRPKITNSNRDTNMNAGNPVLSSNLVKSSSQMLHSCFHQDAVSSAKPPTSYGIVQSEAAGSAAPSSQGQKSVLRSEVPPTTVLNPLINRRFQYCILNVCTCPPPFDCFFCRRDLARPCGDRFYACGYHGITRKYQDYLLQLGRHFIILLAIMLLFTSLVLYELGPGFTRWLRIYSLVFLCPVVPSLIMGMVWEGVTASAMISGPLAGMLCSIVANSIEAYQMKVRFVSDGDDTASIVDFLVDKRPVLIGLGSGVLVSAVVTVFFSYICPYWRRKRSSRKPLRNIDNALYPWGRRFVDKLTMFDIKGRPFYAEIFHLEFPHFVRDHVLIISFILAFMFAYPATYAIIGTMDSDTFVFYMYSICYTFLIVTSLTLLAGLTVIMYSLLPEREEEQLSSEGIEKQLPPVKIEKQLPPEGIEKNLPPEGTEKNPPPEGIEKKPPPDEIELKPPPETQAV